MDEQGQINFKEVDDLFRMHHIPMERAELREIFKAIHYSNKQHPQSDLWGKQHDKQLKISVNDLKKFVLSR